MVEHSEINGKGTQVLNVIFGVQKVECIITNYYTLNKEWYLRLLACQLICLSCHLAEDG